MRTAAPAPFPRPLAAPACVTVQYRPVRAAPPPGAAVRRSRSPYGASVPPLRTSSAPRAPVPAVPRPLRSSSAHASFQQPPTPTAQEFSRSYSSPTPAPPPPTWPPPVVESQRPQNNPARPQRSRSQPPPPTDANPPAPSSAQAAAGVWRSRATTEFVAGSRLEANDVTYLFRSSLGKGCSSEVFKAEATDKRIVAIKVMPHLPSDTGNVDQQAEANVMVQLKHPNVIASQEFFQHQGQCGLYTCVIMEYCGGGSLFHRISRRFPRDFTTKLISQLLYQLASGLEYLHNLGVIHGDLKSENVLLTTKLQPKISDFGCCLKVAPDDEAIPRGRIGDLVYAAEECVREGKVCSASDMWGLGCILCEMATLRLVTARAPLPGYLSTTPAAVHQMLEEMKFVHDGRFRGAAVQLCRSDYRQRMRAAAVKVYAATLGGQVESPPNSDGARDGFVKWLAGKFPGRGT